MADIHFGIDQTIWEHLNASKDAFIHHCMNKVLSASSRYCFVEPEHADMVIKTKFRGINPWVVNHRKMLRMTEFDSVLRQEYEGVQETMKKGFSIKLMP